MNQFFDVFQLVALGCFLITVIERTIHLRVRQRINPIRLGVGRNGVRHLMTLSLFAGVNVWAAAVVLCVLRIGDRLLPTLLGFRLISALPLRVLGAALVVLGFTLFIMALAALGSSWRLGIDEQNPGHLVTNGIYAYSRHPIYLFFNLYFIGTLLINGAPFFLLFALLAGLNLHGQMLQEERFLCQRYGRAYRDYIATTGRYWTLPVLLPRPRVLAGDVEDASETC